MTVEKDWLERRFGNVSSSSDAINDDWGIEANDE
jgi:hypothetical protein